METRVRLTTLNQSPRPVKVLQKKVANITWVAEERRWVTIKALRPAVVAAAMVDY